ncbi:TlpA family protein disulfide reductase [Dyadobacter luticola]|nr:TlpA disulfide reductase family protein [Dyadobacter luticola]
MLVISLALSSIFSFSFTDKIHTLKSGETSLILKAEKDTNSIFLADMTGKKLTFDDIKKRHAGKILVVDFWASWCGPCREIMPESTKLVEALKGKDIVFVYLSIDDNVEKWKKANEQEKLTDYTENYLILDYRSSRFLKEQKLTFIPRAMIFDKAGRLKVSQTIVDGMGQLGYFTKMADSPVK